MASVSVSVETRPVAPGAPPGAPGFDGRSGRPGVPGFDGRCGRGLGVGLVGRGGGGGLGRGGRGVDPPGPPCGGLAGYGRRPGTHRGSARRRRPIDPIGAPRIPRPAHVVAAPVIAEIEGDDADPKSRAHVDHGYPPLLVVVIQIAAVEPAVVALPIHVAPREIVEASIDGQQAARRNAQDDGIIGARPRPQVNLTLGVGIARVGGRVEQREGGGDERERQPFHV